MSRPPSPMYLYARSVRRPPYPIYLYARSASRPPYPIYLYAGSASRPPCPIYVCAGSAGRPPYPIYLCAVRMKTNLVIQHPPGLYTSLRMQQSGIWSPQRQQQKNEGEPTYWVKTLHSFWLGGSLCLNKQSARFKKSKKQNRRRVTYLLGQQTLRSLHQMDRHFFWCGEPLCLNK